MFSTLKSKIMDMKWVYSVLLALPLSGLPISSSNAQQALGIAAVVNDEMISMYDLNTRIDSVIAFAGFANTPENRRRFATQVLRTLIDEQIKLQEATRLKVTVKKSKVAVGKADFEKQNRMKPGQLKQFIKNNRLQESSIDEQIKARIIWNEMVASRFARDIKISEEEINEIVEKHQKNKGKPEDLVYEIFLPINKKDQEQDVIRLAERLITQMKKGTSFSVIAQNFSQSSTASSGGALGWTLRGELEQNINNVVQSLRPGQLSKPIRTDEGILIVLLRKTRTSRGLDGPPAGPEKVKLFQLHLALSKNSSSDHVEQQMKRAQLETQNINSCQSMAKLAGKIGSPLSGELGTFEISKISQKMRLLVKNVPSGRSSAPQKIDEGVIVLMVCDRIIPKAIIRTPTQQSAIVRNQLVNERLNLAAKRYFRDLTRASFVDVRLSK